MKGEEGDRCVGGALSQKEREVWVGGWRRKGNDRVRATETKLTA